MLDWIQRFLAAPVFPEDEEKTRMARLLNPILFNLIWGIVPDCPGDPIYFP